MRMLMLLFLLVLHPIPMPAEGLDEAIRFYEKGEFKQAVNLLLRLKNLSQDDPDVRLWLGKSYLKTGDWDNAVREFEKSTQLKPSDAHSRLWLGRACGAKAAHAFVLIAPRWAHRVLTEFETARKLSPNDVDVRFDLLEFYLEAPGIMGGGKDKAHAEALAIEKLNPKKGYLARSTILSKDKKMDQAKKELIQATIAYPNDANAFKDLADYLLDRRDFEGALEYSRKALSLDQQSKRSLLIMAAAQTMLRTDLDHSMRILLDLVSGPLTDNDPTFEEAYYWLGECYLAMGDKSKAQQAFLSVLTFNPDYDKAREHVSELR